VICPVGADPTFDQKKCILETLGQEFGLRPFFPLDKRPKFSVRGAIEDIQGAEFVFADLALERPSCYFELGLAQARGIPICIVATPGTVIHQIGESSEVALYSDLNEYRLAVARILSQWPTMPKSIEQCI